MIGDNIFQSLQLTEHNKIACTRLQLQIICIRNLIFVRYPRILKTVADPHLWMDTSAIRTPLVANTSHRGTATVTGYDSIVSKHTYQWCGVQRLWPAWSCHIQEVQTSARREVGQYRSVCTAQSEWVVTRQPLSLPASECPYHRYQNMTHRASHLSVKHNSFNSFTTNTT